MKETKMYEYRGYGIVKYTSRAWMIYEDGNPVYMAPNAYPKTLKEAKAFIDAFLSIFNR